MSSWKITHQGSNPKPAVLYRCGLSPWKMALQQNSRLQKPPAFWRTLERGPCRILALSYLRLQDFVRNSWWKNYRFSACRWPPPWEKQAHLTTIKKTCRDHHEPPMPFHAPLSPKANPVERPALFYYACRDICYTTQNHSSVILLWNSKKLVCPLYIAWI